MKKVLAILLVCMMMLALVGCAAQKVQKAQNDLESVMENLNNGEADAEDVQNALEQYNQAIDGNVKGYQDINEYIADVKAMDTYEQNVQANLDAGMETELLADGNNLVYRYTYTVPVAEDAAELISQSLADNESMLAATADTIRLEAPCVELVVWEYYSMDGELLATLAK